MSECATGHCTGEAVWHAVPEGNEWGSKAPRRCVQCCDAIAWHGISAGGLYDLAQLAPWSQIPRDYRGVGLDGVRRVLVLIASGTALVPWYGPAGT